MRRVLHGCLAAMAAAAAPVAAQRPDPPVIPRTRADQLYERASAQFDAYEAGHGGFVTTANVRMHYLQWGGANGVPLIWVHGTNSTAYEMAPFAEQLVAAGYRVIAIEYYGHGRTPIPDHEVSLWHVADDIAALMDSLEIPKAVIGGWSRGGTIAAVFYDAYPARALGLVLEDGGSFSFLKTWDRVPDERMDHYLEPWGVAVTPRTYPSAVEAFFHDVQWNKALDKDDPVWGFQTLAQLSRGADGQWMINRGLTPWLQEDSRLGRVNLARRPSLTPLFQWSMMALLPTVIFRHLAVPMLIIDPVQDDDLFAATDQNQQLQRAHPSLVTHRIYANTSHAAKLERPEWFIRDMGEFVERVKEVTPLR